jgi:uncharacterized protein YjiS (DUF1127 family)
MEMVMSMSFAAPPAAHGTLARPQADGPVAVLQRWWVACMARRFEAAAIGRLSSMSDRELKDIGLVRSNIVPAVRGHTRG